jgi:hypothetical protein
MNHPCHRHPDREGPFFCQKHSTFMCPQCACCPDARLYCRFRTACVVAELTRAGELNDCKDSRDVDHGSTDP